MVCCSELQSHITDSHYYSRGYTTAEAKQVFCDQRRLQRWLEVEAALAAKWLGVRLAIPMHYRFNEGEAFVAELQKQAPEIEALLLKPGDRYTFNL